MKDKIKRIFQKLDSKPVKSRSIIEEKGFLLINEHKEVIASLREFDKLDFLSEPEERTRVNLVLRRERLIAQIKLLGWI